MSLSIRLIAVGRWKQGPERALFEKYAQRLPWSLQLLEIDDRQPGSAKAKIARQAKLIRARLTPSAPLVVLHEGGKQLSSPDLAEQIAHWRDDGQRIIDFVVGGADGLETALIQQAHLCLAFGRTTWPHLLVRPLIAEQLFRCHTILSDHPYHRS